MDVAKAAALAGGEVILKAHKSRQPGQRIPATDKGLNDFVTEVDHASEARIVSVIKEVFPGHDIQAEESSQESYISDYRWIIDPLDGTTNFIHGFPVFAVSIGLSYQGRMQLGVVFDPVRNEMFHAEAGQGAWLNDTRIQVSEVRDLREALLLTGFPFKGRQYLRKYLDVFAEMFRASSAIRRAGSASLDLAYVACGRADAFFEMLLSPWDIAAGAVLIFEAGGLCTDFLGGEAYMPEGHIVAGHESLVRQMLPLIERQMPIW
jgi:myo-inositol-1(or 4)-monophosphatase